MIFLILLGRGGSYSVEEECDKGEGIVVAVEKNIT